MTVAYDVTRTPRAAYARIAFRPDASWTASLRVDIVFNWKYLFVHPFPQRTILGDVSYAF